MTMLYSIIHVLHILAVIAWMAAMMYLPRLFVNHHQAEKGGEAETFFIGMERRLAKGIMTPSMIATWVFGLALLGINTAWGAQPWLWTKLVLVIGMSGIHGFYIASMKKFAAGERPRTERFWRIMNEVPFLLLIVIVFLVVVKPFV